MKYIEITNKKKLEKKDLNILKREYIAIVSHKLLSPLTIIKWNIELIKNKNSRCDKYKENFDAIDANIKKLETYSDILMKVAEAQNLLKDEQEIENSSNKFKVNFNSIVSTLVEKYTDAVKEKGLKLVTNCVTDGDFVVNYKKDYIAEIVDSLIKNATDYSKENLDVNIECKLAEKQDYKQFNLDRNRKYVVIAVESEGLNVETDEYDLIGESFFRGSQAKMSGVKGYGLSLYLSKILLENIFGKLFFISNGKKMKFVAVFYVKMLYN